MSADETETTLHVLQECAVSAVVGTTPGYSGDISTEGLSADERVTILRESVAVRALLSARSSSRAHVARGTLPSA